MSDEPAASAIISKAGPGDRRRQSSGVAAGSASVARRRGSGEASRQRSLSGRQPGAAWLTKRGFAGVGTTERSSVSAPVHGHVCCSTEVGTRPGTVSAARGLRAGAGTNLVESCCRSRPVRSVTWSRRMRLSSWKERRCRRIRTRGLGLDGGLFPARAFDHSLGLDAVSRGTPSFAGGDSAAGAEDLSWARTETADAVPGRG
jgi:hypothetical protein